MTPRGRSNPWVGGGVRCYAHRGGAKEGPSSTLAAMRGALASGADALELDVHMTLDGALVCCHDDSVDRTTNGTGRIASMTLGEIRSLDAAWWYSPGHEAIADLEEGAYPFRGRARTDPAYRIPTLSEVLEEFPSTPLNLDIKKWAPAPKSYVGVLADELERVGRREGVIVASFHDAALAEFREISEVDTAATLGETVLFIQALRSGSEPDGRGGVAFQVPMAMAGTEIVDGAFVDAAHRAGVAVHVWTIDDMSDLERLVGLGVDGVMTDTPSVVARRLGVLGARHTPLDR